jgi:hypothetical protein
VTSSLGWPMRITIGVCLGLIVRFFWPSDSDASHSFPFNPVDADGDTVVDDPPHQHLLSITSLQPEVFCTISYTTQITSSQMLSMLTNTLIYANPAEGWNGIGEGRVSFVPTALACGHGVDQRIDYSAQSAGCDGTSCLAALLAPKPNPLTSHKEYERASIVFYPPHLLGSTNERHRIINHETGHALGLCDGGRTAPDPQFGCESNPYHDKCTDSVMHSYGCPTVVWPSSSDRHSVISLMPVGSGSGGGGGGGRGCPFALPC